MQAHDSRVVEAATVPQREVLDVFDQELAEAAIVNIGHADTRGGFFTRVLHLIEHPQGQRLAPCAAASISPHAAKQKAPAI
jgi:ABC-type uncharacterized transport system fused permease/ATPase subunit